MNILTRILNKFDGHTQELISGTSVAFVLKIIAAGMAFILNIVLARLLGADGSGLFFLAFTIVIIMAGIGTVGMENALVKFIAANISVKKYGKVLGVYKKAILYSLIVAGTLMAILYFSSHWISENIFNKIELGTPLSYMSLAILPLALLNLHSYSLQGLKQIAKSISILSIFVPLITSISAILFISHYGINAAFFGYIIATYTTLIIAFSFWRKSIRPFANNIAEFESKLLLDTSIPLLGVNLMTLIIVWSPLLFLGVWGSNEDVGIYNAASRTAMLTSFVLIAVNSIAAPKFSELHIKGDLKTIALVVCNSTNIMTLIASPILLIFIIFPDVILSLFGEEFKNGERVLIILAIGQFINVITGSVGYLLMMTGHERLVRNVLFYSAVLGVVLCNFLIQYFGVIGAAIAATIILSFQNIIMLIIVWKKLGIIALPNFKIL